MQPLERSMDATPRYNEKVVRQFALVTVFWGIIGMAVGVLIAAQLPFPSLKAPPFSPPPFSLPSLKRRGEEQTEGGQDRAGKRSFSRLLLEPLPSPLLLPFSHLLSHLLSPSLTFSHPSPPCYLPFVVTGAQAGVRPHCPRESGAPRVTTPLSRETTSRSPTPLP